MGWAWKDAGRRSGGGRASLVAGVVVLLLALNSFLLHPRDESVRPLGRLRRPPQHALHLRVRASSTTTGSPRNPTTGYVVRRSPRTYWNGSHLSRSAKNSWPWQPGCERWVLRRRHWAPRGCSRHGTFRRMRLRKRRISTWHKLLRWRAGQSTLRKPDGRCGAVGGGPGCRAGGEEGACLV